jgi:hypothetical protein
MDLPDGYAGVTTIETSVIVVVVPVSNVESFKPLSDAWIVALPPATALATPTAEIVAIDVFEELHVT